MGLQRQRSTSCGTVTLGLHAKVLGAICDGGGRQAANAGVAGGLASVLEGMGLLLAALLEGGGGREAVQVGTLL